MSNIVIKRYRTNLSFQNGRGKFTFPIPFENDCIAVVINDDGNDTVYESFTAGHISKTGFQFQCFRVPSYSSTDAVFIIAIGY